MEKTSKFVGFILLYHDYVYLFAVNLISFALFGIDKLKSLGNKKRISEKTLLFFTFIGGTPGSFAGKFLFKHKTSKRSFNVKLAAIAVIQVFLITGWIFLKRNNQ
ncbi:MAG: hypothetical protein CSB55_05390 [Candidatus Cloacimonadota bacterium]|nr:MAG: hypothetical protein CSB55_05390 [Candidatus Cloacimonadota bacterium]